MKFKVLKIIFIIVFSILMIPFIASQISESVNWTLMDYVIAGGILLVTALIINFVFNKIKNLKYRTVIIILLFLLLLLLWAEMGVGIFGSPIAGN
ncbi:hypothetical protein [Pontimicrobium sp. IMCC45349]|uniref:hypothetical protein n=1 Tax=Pontimicrobium sp. IMCC45349 TaxID=3391574 RepID=UPI0039A31A93